jgi:hypothetical protein
MPSRDDKKGVLGRSHLLIGKKTPGELDLPGLFLPPASSRAVPKHSVDHYAQLINFLPVGPCRSTFRSIALHVRRWAVRTRQPDQTALISCRAEPASLRDPRKPRNRRAHG